MKETDCATTANVLTAAEWGDDDENTPVYAVVSAVAKVEDTDPVDLPPLYNAIDSEALNNLFTSRSESTVEQLTFQYAGYTIVVSGSGEVHVKSDSEA
ncbi:hypothetical protein EA473_19810 [Natrarchaeobius chitinivorans]|uniref:Halobacterial output domain-containing protein n=1 Tax=Natrarchaeobius chitinivorans TaxID=1679083 RepID=A0A3N6LNE5_NATCH|nr:HalOD1 output domain-containing protein [Natrarchaeobius chitinivorans]RQG90893.1 hypothetical protein EA473_19810 [Natrarchaeobius chitinivorans]